MKVRPKHLYSVLCALGTFLPYTQFIPWVLENALNVPLLVDQIASSRFAAFGWLDAIVAALALFVFISSDGPRHQVSGLQLRIVGTPAVVVSLGLPLHLLLREICREAAV